jgi:hypothetical protein
VSAHSTVPWPMPALWRTFPTLVGLSQAAVCRRVVACVRVRASQMAPSLLCDAKGCLELVGPFVSLLAVLNHVLMTPLPADTNSSHHYSGLLRTSALEPSTLVSILFSPISGGTPGQAWIFVHPGAYAETQTQLTATLQGDALPASLTASVQLVPRQQDLVRLRLSGPQATQVLRRVLRRDPIEAMPQRQAQAELFDKIAGQTTNEVRCVSSAFV